MSYLLKEGFAGLKRTKWASLTSIFSLFLALVLLGIFARLATNIYDRALNLKESIELEVFLYDLDSTAVVGLEEQLLGLSEVVATSYISKDSAASIMRTEFGSGVEELVALDFLPASFKVELSASVPYERIDEMASELGQWEGIETVQFNASLVQMLEKNLDIMLKVGTWLGLLVLLAAILLVFNTIRLTVYARRDVIKAMKLVGATDRFIRAPFVIEGVLQGVIAGILSVVSLYLLFDRVFPSLVPQLGVLAWPFGRWYYMVGGLLLLALIMGWMGSRWAASTFIRKTKL
jgi:cell division transport system permease protein